MCNALPGLAENWHKMETELVLLSSLGPTRNAEAAIANGILPSDEMPGENLGFPSSALSRFRYHLSHSLPETFLPATNQHPDARPMDDPTSLSWAEDIAVFSGSSTIFGCAVI